MPALHFLQWKEYFSIFPFSEDRQDLRMAVLASVIYNTSGKTFKSTLGPSTFLFDFLGSRSEIVFTPKSIEQQLEDSRRFKEKLLSLKSARTVQ